MTVPAHSPDAARLLAELIAGRFPDARGRFGPFGGRYVPETLIPALDGLERGVREHLGTREFRDEFASQLKSWVGRPTALTYAARLSARWGAKVWLKREDLAHTGAHKINNAIGQALLAQRLGAQLVPVTSGDRTLRAAIDEAMRDWVSAPLGTYYLLGSVVGPHPYPYLVRELQAVIGREAREQPLPGTRQPRDAQIA